MVKCRDFREMKNARAGDRHTGQNHVPPMSPLMLHTKGTHPDMWGKAFWKRKSQKLKVLKVLVPMLETQEEGCSIKEREGRWEQRGHRLRGVKHMAL